MVLIECVAVAVNALCKCAPLDPFDVSMLGFHDELSVLIGGSNCIVTCLVRLKHEDILRRQGMF